MKIPNSLLFSCADSAYNHLSKILQDTINDIAPIKDICIKGNTKPQFASNIIGLIRKRDLKKKLKKGFYIRNCMLITNTLRNNEIQFKGRLNERKQANVKEQLQKNTNNPKDLWKAVTNLGMPCQASHQPKICLRENNLLQFNENKNASTFKDFYRNLAADLVN